MIDVDIVCSEKSKNKTKRILFSIKKINMRINEKIIENLFDVRKQKLIIFDVDDTLIRRIDIPKQLSITGKEAINEGKRIIKKYGISVSMPPEDFFSEKEIFEKYGNTIRWFMNTWLSASGVSDPDIKQFLIKKYVKKYYSRIEKSIKICKTFIDVKHGLQFLKDKGFIIGAMSNSSKEAIINTFKKNKILEFFIYKGNPLIVGGDEIPKSKETVIKLMTKAGVRPKKCILIGDSGNDIKSGREAGISKKNTIGIYRGITPLKNLEVIIPKPKIIRSLKELNKVL